VRIKPLRQFLYTVEIGSPPFWYQLQNQTTPTFPPAQDDFLRENLFNILGSLQDRIFLDLFAGSGSVGLEAASRGAQEVYFVEKNKNAI